MNKAVKKKSTRSKRKASQQLVVLRQLRMSDFDELVAMQALCFPGIEVWRREQIESQLEIFPEGQLVIEYEGHLAASASSLIVDFSEYSEWHDWKAIADNGFIRTHDPEGDALYGIEMMVHPKYRGMKLARRLYEARKEICRAHNLARIIIGGRIPGYHRYADTMSAAEYVQKAIKRDVHDPVLTPQLSNGFVLRGLIPAYFPEDDASRGYATHLEWSNLEYRPISRRSTEIGSVQARQSAQARLSVVQYLLRNLDTFEDFAQQVEFFVDVASDHRSDFVVFPELMTAALLSMVEPLQPGEAARRLTEFTPQYEELMTSLAVKYDINIVGGSQLTMEGDDLYNTGYFFRRDGSMEIQHKLHITPAERKWWGITPGSRLNVFKTDRGKVAILICYDIEFPELARMAAQQGAQILFVPFASEERNGYLRVRHCAQARCIENHIYVAISGAVGNLPFVENADVHYAQSGIFTPADFAFSRDGIAQESMPNIEQLIVHDLDLAVLRHHRLTGTVQNWNDRRRDLYQIRFEQDGEVTII